MTNSLLLLILAVGVLLWGGTLVSRLFSRITVYEYQHVLLFSKGRFIQVLKPGVYWHFRPNFCVEILDARPKMMTIPGQDVISKDGVSLKVSLLVSYRVTDPKVAILNYENYEQQLYAIAQTELRRLVGEATIEQILENRNDIGHELQKHVIESGDMLGLEILSLSVKDLMFPAQLKESFSQVARAKQEGLAALEKARGESAALRNLANAARLLENNPNLYSLRLLSSLDRAQSVVVHLKGEGQENP